MAFEEAAGGAWVRGGRQASGGLLAPFNRHWSPMDGEKVRSRRSKVRRGTVQVWVGSGLPATRLPRRLIHSTAAVGCWVGAAEGQFAAAALASP